MIQTKKREREKNNNTMIRFLKFIRDAKTAKVFKYFLN